MGYYRSLMLIWSRHTCISTYIYMYSVTDHPSAMLPHRLCALSLQSEV